MAAYNESSTDVMKFLVSFQKNVLQEFKTIRFMMNQSHSLLRKYLECFCKSNNALTTKLEVLIAEDIKTFNQNLDCNLSEGDHFVNEFSTTVVQKKGPEYQIVNGSKCLKATSSSDSSCNDLERNLLQYAHSLQNLSENIDRTASEEISQVIKREVQETFAEQAEKECFDIDGLNQYNQSSRMSLPCLNTKRNVSQSNLVSTSMPFYESVNLDIPVDDSDKTATSQKIKLQSNKTVKLTSETARRLAPYKKLAKKSSRDEDIEVDCIGNKFLWKIDKARQNKHKIDNRLKLTDAEQSDLLQHDPGDIFPANNSILTQSSELVESNDQFCQICGKMFASRYSLLRHIHTHVTKTQISKYRCNICGKYCSSNSNLLNHIRVHTGEKPFSCLACGKSFTLKGSLQQHLKIHTGEKPYKCSVCNRSFLSRFSFKRHSKLHNKTKS